MMKRGVDDRLSGLEPDTTEVSVRISKVLIEKKRATSELFFVECRRQPIETADTRRFTARDVTLIYLSFASGDISIALPGCGVTLEGGTNGT